MSPELDKKLVEDFPDLFANRHGDMRTTAMCWGFECGDGWEKIIRSMAEQLTWLSKASGIKFTATQVKEKYGTLRFYFNSETPAGQEYSPVVQDIAQAIEWHAESKSAGICENCGDYGHTRGRGWRSTLCAKHAYERQYPINEYEAETLGVTDHIPEQD